MKKEEVWIWAVVIECRSGEGLVEEEGGETATGTQDKQTNKFIR